MTHRLLDADVFFSVISAAKCEELVGTRTMTLKLLLETLPELLNNEKVNNIHYNEEIITPEKTLDLVKQEILALRLSDAEVHQLLTQLKDISETLGKKQV